MRRLCFPQVRQWEDFFEDGSYLPLRDEAHEACEGLSRGVRDPEHLQILVDQVPKVDSCDWAADRAGGGVAPAASEELQQHIEHLSADDVGRNVRAPGADHLLDGALEVVGFPGHELVRTELA